jgi:gliding motility-associated-like protein
MKKNLLFFALLMFISGGIFSQGNNCASATAFCGSATFPNNTATTSAAGPSYGCLTTQPNPAWFFIKTTAAGAMTYNISQVSSGGSGIDVDFVAWGPFSSMTGACSSLTGSCSGDHACSGNIEDCSYSTASVETMTLNSPGAGNYYVILITNYADVVGTITFNQTGGPPSDCSVTCPSVTSGNGFLLSGGGNMPATVACNAANMGLIASNNTPFGNPITPAIIISFNNNGDNSNSVNWYENGTFILCSGPSPCSLPLTLNANNDLQYSTMSPSATNTITLCETNAAGGDVGTYGIIDASTGTTINTGTWIDDGACQTITIPPGTIQGVSTWSISPACPGCLTSTDWGYTVFSPSTAGPGTYNICYSYDPPGTCPTYTYCQSITVTNPYNASWTAPAAVCSNSGTINLTSLLSGSATAGGTWSGTGVSGTTFNPATSGAGTFAVTYTVGSGACSAAQTSNIIVNPIPVATATPSSQTICSGNATGIALSSSVGGTTFSWTVSQTNVSGASAGSGSSIAQTLNATSTSAGTAVYTITPVAGGCTGTPITVTITVNPRPVATATPASQVICSGASTGIALTSNVAGTTFAWTAPSQTGASGGSAGSGTSISQVLTATGTTAGTVTYTVTPTAAGCTGTPILVTITVNPVPVATATPSSQSFCSGGSTGISLTSNVTGTTFSWTVSQSGVSGASAGSGTTIVQALTATGASAGTATYTITPTAGGCSGSPITVTITVNPGPVAVATPASQTICSGNATAIALSSTTPGTTFSWTVSQSGVSGASAGSGSSIAQTLNATGTTAGTATYTITPTSGGCVGSPITLVITVSPRPVVTATPSSQTICSGAATGIALTSNVASTTYSWTVVQSGVTGASAGSGSSIAQTLNTSGTVAGTAVYTITPTAAGCAGTPITVTITVNPVPVATATPSSQTFCSPGTTAISLTSNVSGTTFNWTVTQSGVTGAVAGSGSTISQGLSTTGASAGTAVYTITPSVGGCTGSPVSVTITVNPPANPAFNYSSSTFCQTGTNPTPTITGTAGGTFTSSPAGLSINSATGTINLAGSTLGSYNVTYSVGGACPNSSVVPITITSAPSAVFSYAGPYCSNAANPSPTFGPGASGGTFVSSPAGLTFVSTSTGQINLATTTPGTYSITNNIAASGGCAAASFGPVTVVINPTPGVTATPASQNICSGNSTAVTLSSAVAGTTFAWTVVQSGVSGASAGSGSTIAQSLSTTTTSPGTAVYTITPTAGGCVGTPISVTITVNPIPVAMATPASQAICSGGITSIALSSNVASTTFSWTVTQSGVAGASAGSGTSIAQTLTATGASAGTATYTIVPSANGCPGTPITVVITVNPVPFATATPSSQTICSGNSTAISLSSFTSGTTFSWTVSQSGVSGATAGSGSTIAQALSTTGVTPGSATYTITPLAGTCTGSPITVTITVNPVPVATATPSTQTICSGGSSAVLLSSTVSGTTFSWTVVQSGVSGASAGSGSSISQTLNATGTSAGTAVYTVVPTANGCAGAPVTVTITVNPTPVATATPTTQSVCSGNATSIVLTSNVASTTYTWTLVQTGVSGGAPGAGSSIAQNLVATGSTPGTAVYTITPTANGCAGSPVTVTVTVNPVPVVTATPSSQTICSGNTTGIALSSNVASTTFTWTVSQSGTSGASAGSGSSIAQALTATGITAGTATYTITPTANGCSGTPITVSITVNPSPVVTATPSTQTFCDGGTTSISLSSTVSGTTISWTVAQSGVSGGTAGSGVTIADLLNTTGTSAGTATYTISSSAAGCPGTPITATITVNPIDDASFTYSSSTYCQTGPDPSAVITGLTGGTFSSSPSGLVILNAGTGLIDLSASTAGTYTITYQTAGVCPNSSSITINITNAPSAAFSYTTPLCSSSANPLPAFGSGASAGSFSSTSGLSFVNVNTGEIDLANSTPGTYTVVNSIAAAGGCAAAADSATITIEQSATVTAGADNSVCEASSATLAGSIGGSAVTGTWTSSGSGTFNNINDPAAVYTPSAADVAAGSVTLTFTTDDPSGVCGVVSDDMVLTVNPLDSAAFNYGGATTFCQSGTNPVATITGMPGGSFSSDINLVFISASTGEINLAASSLGAHDIYYTTTGICPNTDTLSITITSAPSTDFTFAAAYCATEADPAPVFGAGATAGVFTATPSGLIIDPSTGVIDLSASTAGAYTVYNTIAAAGGCAMSMDSVTVTVDVAPLVEAGPNAAICAGDTYTMTGDSIGGSATSLTWTSGGTGSFAGAGTLNAVYTPSAADIAAGSVVLYMTTDDPAGACSSVTDSITLTINPTPAAPGIASTMISVCNGSPVGPITVTTTGGTVTWYSDSALTTVVSNSNPFTPPVPTASISYWVTETLGTCEGPATQVDIVVFALPIADTTGVTITAANCGDPTGAITGVTVTSGQPPFTYQWLDSLGAIAGMNADLTSALPGVYGLLITDSNGCTATAGPFTIGSTAGVVAAFTATPTTGETPLTVNFTNASTGAVSYLWQFGTIDTDTATNPVYVILPLGQFPVCLIATNSAGCSDTVCSNIDVYINSVFVIPNVFTPNGDGTNDIFGVSGVGLATMDAEVYNRWGQKEFEWHTVNGGWDGRTASGVEAPDGTYYFMIKAKGIDGKEYFEKGSFSLIR